MDNCPAGASDRLTRHPEALQRLGWAVDLTADAAEFIGAGAITATGAK